MSAATLCAVSPAATAAAPATRVRRSAVRAALLPRDAAPAGGQAVLYVPPRRFRLVASSTPAAMPNERADASDCSASLRTPTTALEIGRQLGGKGGGAAVLEKGGLDLRQSASEFQAKTDDTGGDGGNGGKISNGGSGGDGDEGDDDDYFDDGDEEGGEDGFLSLREALPEQFDRAAIEAVLAEWFKTLADLPAGLRMAVEMGLVSSLQLVRFMSVDCRPTLVRAVHRTMPSPAARAFVGRLMADPSFLGKLALEQLITLAAGAAYEAQQRGARLGAEADLAVVNVLTQLLGNAALVWSLAPTRSYGAAHKHAWQRAVAGLPNYVFDSCGPLRQYTRASRSGALLYKAAQLSGAGLALGAASSAVQSALLARHRAADPSFKPTVPVPTLATSAAGYAAWLGLSGNVRYQLLGGADRWMRERLSSLSTTWVTTAFARLANNHVGDASRLWLLGLPAAPSVLAGGAARITGVPTQTRRTPTTGSMRREASQRRRSSAVSGAAHAPLSFSVSASAGGSPARS